LRNMKVTSYEIVRRAIEFRRPTRLPVRFDELGLSDVHDLVWNQFRPFDSTSDFPARDEWGCVWERTEVNNMGQVKGHPLTDIKNLRDFEWPDPNSQRFYEGMEQQLEGSEEKYVLTGIFMGLFERIHALRGFENTLTDLLLNRDTFVTIADAVLNFDLGIVRNLAERFHNHIHGFSITDDWGTETSLMINPELWDELLKPRYQSLFNEVHSHGWHVWMHSCGRINKILESLIDIGLDVVNLQQPQILGVKEIGAQFRGRICFETLCAHESGGFILSDYRHGEAIGVTIEKKKLMLNAFRDADPWKKSK
jgi:uroporphyrinogen decarboxylase